MTGFNHGLNGALIALVVKQPALAIPLSFASHYATDAVPHFSFASDELLGRKFNRFIKADFTFSIFLMVVLGALFPAHAFLIWACMIAAAIPDIVWWFYRKSAKSWPEGLGKFSSYHSRLNGKVHVSHFYFDTVWFVLVFGLILLVGG